MIEKLSLAASWLLMIAFAGGFIGAALMLFAGNFAGFLVSLGIAVVAGIAIVWIVTFAPDY
jgi:hypothetical protein